MTQNQDQNQNQNVSSAAPSATSATSAVSGTDGQPIISITRPTITPCCTLKSALKYFVSYYLTLNVVLLIILICYSNQASVNAATFFWCLLMALIANVVLSAIGLTLILTQEYKSQDDPETGDASVKMPLVDDKSGSSKTVLTIDSKTLPKPATPGGSFVNLTPDSAASVSVLDKAAIKNVKDAAGKKPGGENNDANASKEANLAAIPSGVLAKDPKESKDKKNTTKKNTQGKKDKKDKNKTDRKTKKKPKGFSLSNKKRETYF